MITFDVGISSARKEKIQKRYFIEKLKNNKSNSGHKHKAQMYTRFFKIIYMMNQSSLDLNWSIDHSTNVLKVALIMPHNIRIIFSIQNGTVFNFATGKTPSQFNDVYMTIPNRAQSVTPCTQGIIRNGYIIPQKLDVHIKPKRTSSFVRKIVLAQFTQMYK